jgi:ligand-binding sensor domain-containing protein
MTYVKIAGSVFLAFSLNLVYAQSWEHFSTKNNIPSNYITGIVTDSYNEKWMTTGGGGLVGFDGKFWKIYNSTTTDERLKTNFLTCITIQGDVKWIGTKTGLYKFEIKDEEETWTEYNSINITDALIIHCN